MSPPAEERGPAIPSGRQRRKNTEEWGRAQAEALWNNLFRQYGPVVDGATVLDLGCSWGYMLKFLADEFKPRLLIGTDVAPLWRDNGWWRPLADRVQFHEGDLPAITGLEGRSIDLILCTSVLQYMTPEGVEANLTRAYDLLRPGGEMLLRTRVWTSYIGADLHADVALPCAHLFYGEQEIERYLREESGRMPRYLNWLTASTYFAIVVRSGFEVVDSRRRMNRLSPEMTDRVAAEFPWIDREELMCAEVEARLIRPLEPDDVADLAG